jgi:hypothetical protein
VLRLPPKTGWPEVTLPGCRGCSNPSANQNHGCPLRRSILKNSFKPQIFAFLSELSQFSENHSYAFSRKRDFFRQTSSKEHS